MTGKKDIWDEKPEPVWVPRGYYSESKIKEDDVQALLLEDVGTWLENLKAKITQLNECLGEYESKEWCDHCIIDSKCAQITLHVQELKEKAKKYDAINWNAIRATLDEKIEAEEKLEAIKKVCKNEFTENFAYSDSKFAEAILKILGVEE